jgi:cytidylate kinase
MTTKPLVAIAIARQVGAGGALLGQRLAKRLGFAYLDRMILQSVADRLGIREADLSPWDEHVSRFRERLAEVFAQGPPDGLYTPTPKAVTIRDARLFQLEAQVIRETASCQNVVVIGRAGFWILQDHPGLLSVFLHAPLSARLPRVMQTHNLRSEQEAGAWIERVERERERFIHTMTGLAAGDACCQHLSIDTHRAGLDLVEEMVVSLVLRVQEQIADTLGG